MKTLFKLLTSALFLVLSVSCSEAPKSTVATGPTATTSIATGHQPQIAVDTEGVTRVVYGQGDKILCATSRDDGVTFSEPVTVGVVGGMHLGMTRGPQIASSSGHSFITAMDKKGNIHSFKLDHGTDKWAEATAVNDLTGSAPEGLMSIAADKKDNFYAVWLDVRQDKKNKIVLSSISGDANAWTKNRVIYQSPDSTVCECCRPSVAVEDAQVNLMFRNWLNGSRDLYLASSDDKGLTFSQPEKLGEGTWKLQGCPMDGGGVTIDDKSAVHTAWQRDGAIFYAQPGEKEVQIGKGRNCSISGKTTPVLSWKDGTELKVQVLTADNYTAVGEGTALQTAELADRKILCVWEKDGEILFKKI